MTVLSRWILGCVLYRLIDQTTSHGSPTIRLIDRCPYKYKLLDSDNTGLDSQVGSKPKDDSDPNLYLLELMKQDPYKTSTTCILLHITTEKFVQEPYEGVTTNSFGCIELVSERDLYLSVHIWSVLRHQDQTNIQTNIESQINCPEAEMFPLSQDVHIPSICHCSAPPNLRLDRLYNGSLQITVWNLPRYAYRIDFYIYANRGHEIVFTRSLAGTNQHNESSFVVTEKGYGPGNYTPVVYAACPGDYEDLQRTGANCPLMDAVQLNHSLQVVAYKPESDESGLNPTDSSLIVALVCVIVVAVTCIASVYTIRRRRKRNKDHLGKKCEEPLNVSALNGTTVAKHSKPNEQTSETLLMHSTDTDKHIAAVHNTKIALLHSSDVNKISDHGNKYKDDFPDIVFDASDGIEEYCVNDKDGEEEHTLHDNSENDFFKAIL